MSAGQHYNLIFVSVSAIGTLLPNANCDKMHETLHTNFEFCHGTFGHEDFSFCCNLKNYSGTLENVIDIMWKIISENGGATAKFIVSNSTNGSLRANDRKKILCKKYTMYVENVKNPEELREYCQNTFSSFKIMNCKNLSGEKIDSYIIKCKKYMDNDDDDSEIRNMNDVFPESRVTIFTEYGKSHKFFSN